MPRIPVIRSFSCRTVSSRVDSAPGPQRAGKTKRPTVKRMTLSFSSVVAMIRGVYCPLATCTATSREPKVKTMKERAKRDHRAGNGACAFNPEPVYLLSRGFASKPRTSAEKICSRIMAPIEMIQSEE